MVYVVACYAVHYKWSYLILCASDQNCCVDSFVSWLYLLFIYVAVCLSRWCFCLTHCQRIYFMSLYATLRGSYLKKSPKTQTNHPYILRSLVLFCIPALKQAVWILVGLFTSQVELIVVTLLQTCGWTIAWAVPRWKGEESQRLSSCWVKEMLLSSNKPCLLF